MYHEQGTRFTATDLFGPIEVKPVQRPGGSSFKGSTFRVRRFTGSSFQVATGSVFGYEEI